MRRDSLFVAIQRLAQLGRDASFLSRFKRTWQGIALVGVAAISLPLQVASSNVVGIPHPERLFLLGLGLWLTGLVAMAAFSRLGASNRTSTVFSFFLVIGISRGFLVLRLFPAPVGWTVLAVGVLALSALVSRVGSDVTVTAILVACAVFLLSSSVIDLYRTHQNWGTSAVTNTVFEAPLDATRTPDIFLVVFDGYGGIASMDSTFGIENPRWVEALRSQGFDIPESSWSAYPSTSMSIPSLLNMSYPVEAGPGFTLSTRKDLYNIIGGDSVLVEALSSWGYGTTMVESGWSGSACGPKIDICVPSAILDEATYFTLEHTVLSQQLLEAYGYAFTSGAQRTMRWLLEHAGSIASNQKPDFVFTHVMAPHPPFLLDRNCEVRYKPEAKGVSFHRAGVAEHIREELYLEQAACLDSFMLELATLIPADATVLFIADHGSDKRRQITEPDQWDTEYILERFNILTAIRIPGCPTPDHIQIPNLFRLVLACFSATTPKDLEPKMFVNGQKSDIVMVDQTVMEEIFDRSRHP